MPKNCYATPLACMITIASSFVSSHKAYALDEKDVVEFGTKLVTAGETIIQSSQILKGVADTTEKWVLIPLDLQERASAEKEGFSRESIIAGTLTKYGSDLVAARTIKDLATSPLAVAARNAASACKAGNAYIRVGCMGSLVLGAYALSETTEAAGASIQEDVQASGAAVEDLFRPSEDPAIQTPCGSMEHYEQVGDSQCGEQENAVEDQKPQEWMLSASSIAGQEAFPEGMCLPLRDGALEFGKEIASLFYQQECSVSSASGDRDFAEIALSCSGYTRKLDVRLDGNGTMKMMEIETEAGGSRYQYNRTFTKCPG